MDSPLTWVEQYTVEEKLELVRLHRNTPGHPVLFEQVMARITAFSHRFDGNAEALGNEIWRRFSACDATMAIWVALLGGHLVGHTLAFMYWQHNEPYIWIQQTETDRRSEKKLINIWLEAIETWGRELNLMLETQLPGGIKIRRIQAQSPRITDAWSRHVGFTPKAVILERLLPLDAKK